MKTTYTQLTLTLILTVLLSILTTSLSAQLMQVTPATTPPFTPINLVNQYFLGDGIEVLNVSYTGDPQAIGYFKIGTQDVGMYDGIIMTTGQAALAPVANNTATGTGFNNSGGADPDLTNIAGTNTFDAAIYTIDFIPSSDTLRFNYVFASEEYTDFVCSFNDVFGFFISGPGITGPYQNMAENIALIPGTATPVSVGTVNGGVAAGSTPPCILTNTQYYVDNQFVSAASGAQSNHQVIYDGFTTVLTATAVVQPCSTYRIKIAIADAIDGIYDSAVFLEANSFGTNGLNVTSQTPSLTNSIAEGCQPAIINFELDNPADNTYQLNYTLGGSAVYGVDYDSIPLSATIAQGQTSFQLPIHAISDNVVEGVDTIEIYANINPCVVDTFLVFIEDAILETPVVNDTFICIGDTAFMDGSISVAPQPGYTFVNDTTKFVPFGTPTTSYMNVSNVPMFNVQQGTIDSVCIDIQHIWVDDLDVFLIAPSGQVLELTTDNGGISSNYTSTCFTPTATTPIAGLGAAASPFTGEFQPEGNWSNLYGSPVNGTWELLVIDDALGFDGNLLRWSIAFAPTYNFNYQWSPLDTAHMSCTDCPDPRIFPDTTSSYTLSVTDAFGCTLSDSALISIGDSLPPPVLVCGTATANSLTLDWSPLNNASSYQVTANGNSILVADTTYTLTGLSPNQTVLFEVTAAAGSCPPNGIDTLSCTTLPCGLIATIIDTIDATCAGYTDGSAIISATGGIGNYYYSINGGAPQTNNGTFANLGAGNYQVIVTDDNNCASTVNFILTEPAGMVLTTTSTDATCHNTTDGAATVAVTGGTMPYTYQWNTTPPQFTPATSPLGQGTYTVAVTDANNCVMTDTAVINAYPEITFNVVATDLACHSSSIINTGNTNQWGTITINVTSPMPTGLPMPIWEWSVDCGITWQSSNVFTGLLPGTYQVTVRYISGICATLPCQSVTITEPAPMSLTLDSTAVSCSGGTDGTATVTAVANGNTPYSYAWNTTPVQTTATATGLSGSNYIVTVTDVNSCMVADTLSVGTLNPIIITTTGTNASCIGVSDGSATVAATGGAGNYTYAWNTVPVQTTATAIGLANGSHIVTVTDANGCNDTASVFIGINTVLTSDMDSTDVSCFGGNDGTATITVSNGVMPYSYSWNIPATVSLNPLTNLSAGMYYVTATDANGCRVSDSIQVNQPNIVTSTIAVADADCNGSATGNAAITAMGGTMPYTYAWSTNPIQTTDSIANLAAGSYFVTITDANSCSYLDTAIIGEPTAITSSTSPTIVSCAGGSDGSATVTPLGGTPAYTYQWSTTPIQDSITATQLPIGTYYVTITDANNCQHIDSATITEQPSIVLTNTSTPVSCSGGTDGTATINATGGVAPYAYTWNTNPVQNTSTATNLSAGDYIVSLTDANGCTAIDTVNVSTINPIILTSSGVNASCVGVSDGSATVVATGGAGNYTYAWNTVPIQTTATATGLATGNYIVTVTDANGCFDTTSVFVDINIVLTSDMDSTDVSCFGGNDGTATITVNNGMMPYTYAWNFPLAPSAGTVTNLSAGTYQVTATDANGCTITDAIQINEPTAIASTINTIDVDCNGSATGTAGVTASGGTMPYSFAWNTTPAQFTATASNLTAGTYIVTITDGNSCTHLDTAVVSQPTALSLNTSTIAVACNGGNDGSATVSISGGTAPYVTNWNNSPPSTTLTAPNLMAGTYTVTVVDIQGCTETATATVVEPNSAVVASITTTIDVLCNGGSSGAAAATGIGGAGNYSYLWSNGATSSSATNLTVGNYTVTITDQNGCSDSASTTIAEPSALSLNITQQSASCFEGNDGQAVVIATGGTPSYSYAWNTTPTQINDTATGLMGGEDYTIMVTDSNGCSESATITIGQPDSITLTMAVTNVPCFGEPDGAITATPSGGTAPYTYLWDASTGNQTTATASGLGLGTYFVTITDSTGCSNTASATIIQPNLMTLSSNAFDVACKGEATGTASVQVTGGTEPYSYSWSVNAGNPTTPVISNLTAGWYQISVTDSIGCIIMDSVFINEPALPLQVDFVTQDITCYAGQDGNVRINASGGTPTYQYSFDSIDYNNSNIVSGLAAGDYQVWVKDIRGCETSNSFTLTEPLPFTVDLGADITLILSNDTTLMPMITNGMPPFSFAWTPIDSFISCSDCEQPMIENLQVPMRYYLSVTDADGCVANDDIWITVSKPRIIYVATGFTPNGNNVNERLFVQGDFNAARIVQFSVYDRWGEKVFETADAPLNDPNFGWDGTFRGQTVMAGVYGWVAEIEFVDGTVIKFMGNTSLIK